MPEGVEAERRLEGRAVAALREAVRGLEELPEGPARRCYVAAVEGSEVAPHVQRFARPKTICTNQTRRPPLVKISFAAASRRGRANFLNEKMKNEMAAPHN